MRMSGVPGRLRWRCRRGNLELDRLLGAYLERRYPIAPAAEQAAFERLLDLPDPELLAVLTGQAPVPDEEASRVVAWFLGTPAH